MWNWKGKFRKTGIGRKVGDKIQIYKGMWDKDYKEKKNTGFNLFKQI